MTMIAYSKKLRGLMIDSGIVINYNNPSQRIETSDRKMYVTEDRRFAIATTGFILHDEERAAFERLFVPRIELYMKDRSVKSLEFNKVEHQAHGLCHQTTVVMTSFGLFVIDIGGVSTRMTFEPLYEDFVRGASTVYFHCAQAMGNTPEKAFEYAIERCDNSRMPIHVIYANDLAPLVPETVEKEAE